MSQPSAPTTDPVPGLLGLSHLGLSVPDLDAACSFWQDVMGLEVTTRMPSLCFLVHREARLGIGLTDHGGAVGGAFDEQRTGLDHLAIAVPDVDVLHAWAARLDRFGVSHSGVVETDAGHHLNLRGPDHFPVELFVLSAGAAAAFGLSAPADGVAHGHS